MKFKINFKILFMGVIALISTQQIKPQPLHDAASCDNLQAKLETIETNIANNNTQIQLAKDNVANEEKTLKEINDKINELNLMGETARANIDQIQTQINDKKAQISKLNAEKTWYSGIANNAKIQKLNADIANLRTELAKSAAMLTAQSTQMSALLTARRIVEANLKNAEKSLALHLSETAALNAAKIANQGALAACA